MLATRKLVTVFSILAAGMIVAPVYALKVTELAAASHGYPGLCDINGKKLADGEFRQWVENNRLHVAHNFAPGNVGLVLPIDILMPIVGFVFLWLSYKYP